ncbi:hypothetical protein IAQ61_005743 [Plenodomus lingam]|uniref:Uncharacterized protein n=1 Tax=Leptosphaeria maculans (strain JN3 / isolate v23.1.3 / race Av1-4-5-6-7-8) TaxID=985895 RepID=E4ZMN8_LEPMJ|nr:hypothetical protein LEMA_P056130.1 [Plenodomus lingam JN3]KAH9870270.1 hypothetical protein IAQ61_005743 [Plenodomus lingam]CBX92907.1 hypothetical protein LEMA_P056130.1 [Plenodomus lingam JN3]
MLLKASLIMSLLSTMPLALSAPTDPPPDYSLPEPYNCGYVLTEHNSSSYAGLPAINWCAPIYYNESIPGYQEAWAYKLFGGCKCGFFREVNDCINTINPPLIEGPTRGGPGHEALFKDPKPRWFNCFKTT